ncbi:MAG: glucose-6-phosphate isomerase [Actinomycetota bacterium]|nr:glucose-6-phosphate isomerase [Actinomycetota bacterium]
MNADLPAAAYGERVLAERLGPIEEPVQAALDELSERDAVTRAWQGDHSLWKPDPEEVADRLGWLESPAEMSATVDDLKTFAAGVAEDGYTAVVLSGMGGSSIFAQTVAQHFPPRPGFPRLHVLDSTDPAAIRRAENAAPLDEIFFLIASKSGTTIETRAHLSYFWHLTGRRGEQFAAITDHDTPLARLAHEHGFRALFENRPDIGGRYAALTHFGLVPAALAGVDVAGLLSRAAVMAQTCAPRTPIDENPAARLAAILAAAARKGRDKLTLLLPPEIDRFGSWLEQLVAESTGKHGTGIVPVIDEPPPTTRSIEVYGDDRLFVTFGSLPGGEELAGDHPLVELPLNEIIDLGGEVFRWEFATALVGVLLGLNPFDQPDVVAAKEATAEALAGSREGPIAPLEPMLELVRPGDYLAILAYVDPGAPVVGALQRVRAVLRDRLNVATMLCVGPGYLHSTGQLHKGGRESGVFLLVVGEDVEELPIPGTAHGFSTLKRAQAAGDLAALRRRGRRAARVDLDELLALGRWP